MTTGCNAINHVIACHNRKVLTKLSKRHMTSTAQVDSHITCESTPSYMSNMSEIVRWRRNKFTNGWIYKWKRCSKKNWRRLKTSDIHSTYQMTKMLPRIQILIVKKRNRRQVCLMCHTCLDCGAWSKCNRNKSIYNDKAFRITWGILCFCVWTTINRRKWKKFKKKHAH